MTMTPTSPTTIPIVYTADQVDLLKRTICHGSSDDEFRLFLHVAQRSGLDPFARQIHAVKRWDSQARRETMSIQTGIDGYRLIADRTERYAGNDEAIYGPDVEDGLITVPTWASVTVHKLVGGQARPFTACARWREYRQTKKDGGPTRMWAQMPYLMLAKCAEALALRKAFPAELSGLYTHEEMAQADNSPPGPIVEQRPPQAAAEASAVMADPAIEKPSGRQAPAWQRFLRRCSALKATLGEERYYGVLGTFEVAHANQIQRDDIGGMKALVEALDAEASVQVDQGDGGVPGQTDHPDDLTF